MLGDRLDMLCHLLDYIIRPNDLRRRLKSAEPRKELWADDHICPYLEKKNMYLSWQDRNHPSFVVYVEAVNEVYNRYFNRGGGYSVQSIF